MRRAACGVGVLAGDPRLVRECIISDTNSGFFFLGTCRSIDIMQGRCVYISDLTRNSAVNALQLLAQLEKIVECHPRLGLAVVGGDARYHRHEALPRPTTAPNVGRESIHLSF